MRRTPGGKGLNVVAARSSAQVGMMYKLSPRLRRRDERGQPDRFVATVIKSKRKGKVLIDYLRYGSGDRCRAVFDARCLALSFLKACGERAPPWIRADGATTRP